MTRFSCGSCHACFRMFVLFVKTQHVVNSLVFCRDLVLASACPELQKTVER